jgi:hypothetical protein
MNGPHLLDERLKGLSCAAVIRTAALWQFTFGQSQASLNLHCPWRLLVGGAIAYGCDDHEQQFGLPERIDGVKRTEGLLSSSLVTRVSVREGCGDLEIAFDSGVRLEAFNNSAGYEGWTCSLWDGPVVVALGGGNILVWQPPGGDANARKV